MKLKTLQENFAQALTTCSRIATNKVQLPILANILLKTQKNKLLVCATNLELSISLSIGAKVEEEGEITVSAKTLTEIVNNLKPGHIDLEVEKEVLKIFTPMFEARVVGMDSSDFPQIPQETGVDLLTIPSQEMLEALECTLFAVSTDETRPVLTGVLLIVKGKNLSLVATDGFRLSQKKLKLDLDSEEKRLILPKSALVEVLRLSREDEVIGLSFKKSENQIIFGISNVVLSSRVIEGDFPDFERIIPRNTKFKVLVDKEDFLRAVKLASVFAKDLANVIKLEIRKGIMEVISESSQSGTQKTLVDVKIEGDLSSEEKFLVAFNYRFLEEFLAVVKSDEVQMEFTDSNSPALFLDPKDTQFLHIIMPVRLTS